MPAMSDGIVRKVVVMAVLCSQDAHRSCDPDAFDPAQGDYVENYDIQLFETMPSVGMTLTVEGESWAIAQVQTYQTGEADPTAFALAICTPDGSIPIYRDDWDGEAPLLYIPLTSDDVLRNEDGSCNFGIFFQESELDSILDEAEWPFESVQWFTPDSHLAGGFRQVALCWVRQTSVLAA